MSVVIYRMPMIVPPLPAPENKGKWDIEFFRQNQNTMRRMVKEHGLLTFEYAVLSTRLIQDITKLKSLHDSIPKELQDQLTAVIRLSELLELLYDSYLNVPKKANALSKERAICLSYVTSEDCPKRDDLCSPLIDTSKIREVTAKLNWLRLLLVRTRRLLNSLIPLLRNWHINYRFLVHLDSFVAPIFNYLSWLFYIPRFLVNSGLLLKHLIPGRWMSDEEKRLGWSIRLQVQLERRWFELTNDLGWGIAGILCCFVLIGPLATAGLYFGVAFFVFDVLTGALRSLLDFRRYKRLASDYANLVEYTKLQAGLKNSTDDYLPELEAYHRYLRERISYEHKRMLLNFFVPIIILIAMCTALFSNPIIPFMGAIVLVSTTILAYLTNRHLEKIKPLDSIKDNVKFRFFSPRPSLPSALPPTTISKATSDLPF